MIYQFLIIYEIVPENTKIFSLVTDNIALCEQVRACHRQYGNSINTDDDIQDFINTIDEIAELIYSDETEEDIKQFKDPVKLTELSPNIEIVHTGFIL